MNASEADPSPGTPIPVVVHLSRDRRGTTQRLVGEALRIGTSSEAEIRLPNEGAVGVGGYHATLTRRGQTYELETAPGRKVWVNGDPTERLVLASGDLLEIGEGGPVLRFRLYPPGSRAYKTLAEAFSDCVDCARLASDRRLGQTAVFLAGAPRELATQTSRWFRAGVVAVLVLLTLSAVGLLRWSQRLEERLAGASDRLTGITELLERSERWALWEEDLKAAKAEIEARLATTVERLEALEVRSEAGARVISTAARSVVFLQGAYGFVERQSGQPLRLLELGPDGQPVRSERGEPLVGPAGQGPVVEALFTGTGFVATPDGLVLTNRHVAVPWDFDAAARSLIRQGFEPVMRRFLGYLPESAASFEVELVAASDEADIAVLRCDTSTGSVPALRLDDTPPQPGEEVIVLGYPTGIRALLARADETFVAGLIESGERDFWTVTRRLSEEGYIAPLATRGIVGQVTDAAIVYDAETTRGGSGGPVLGLDGEVVAVNVAIMPEFGGSNLGVPAAFAQKLLARARSAIVAAPAETD